jgi:hypothetical protein
VTKRVRTLRRVLIDSLLAVGSAGLLLALLATFDERVRDEFAATLNGRNTAEVTATTGHARKLVSTAYAAVKVQANEHRPLAIMLVAGTVLGLVMFRM